MQVYALKMVNFIRYGEKDNTIVFDLSENEKQQLASKKTTMDDIYDEVMKDPMSHIDAINSGEKIFMEIGAVTGIIGGDLDESNGAGKSTMFEAMCYAIYDRIIRRTVNSDKVGTAGDSVAIKFNGQYPEKMTECYVEMLFGVNDKIYTVKRGRTFSKSKKTGLPDQNKPMMDFKWVNAPNKDDKDQASHRTSNTTEAIVKAVSMDYDVFVNSIMFGQSDAGRFLTGTDKTKKEMLISALRLDNIVTGCLESVREKIKVKKANVDTYHSEVEMITQMLAKYPKVKDIEDTIKSNIQAIEDMSRSITVEAQKILNLSNSSEIKEIQNIKEEGSKVKVEYQSLKDQKEVQIKEWRDHHGNVVANITSKQETISKTDNKVKDIENKIRIKTTEVSSFDLKVQQDALSKSQRAKEVKPKYEKEFSDLTAKSNEFLVSITQEETEVKRLRAEISILTQQLKNSKDEFICDKCKSKVTKEHLQLELSADEKMVSNINDRIALLRKDSEALQVKLLDAKSKVQKLNDLINKESEIKGVIKSNEDSVLRIKEMSSDLEEATKSKKEYQDELVALQLKKQEYLDKAQKVKDQYDSKITESSEKINALAIKLKDAESKASNVRDAIRDCENRKIALEKQRDAANSEIGSKNQLIITIKEREEKVKEISIKLKDAEKWYTRYLLLEEICGLEGVQTRIVQKWLPLLNVHVREILNILTQGKMDLELVINDKSKIDLIIRGGQADTFEMSSGGEKMIVRLAIDISLGLLLFSRTTHKAEMIVLDEIFGPLDNSKTQAVFNLLDVLKDKFKRVLVISHKDEINKRIADHIVVEKEPGDFGLSKIRKVV